jgi:prophage maintenance system killer protein
MLKLNGYEFDAPNSAELGEVIEQAIEGLIDEDDFIETMREFVISS